MLNEEIFKDILNHIYTILTYTYKVNIEDFNPNNPHVTFLINDKRNYGQIFNKDKNVCIEVDQLLTFLDKRYQFVQTTLHRDQNLKGYDGMDTYTVSLKFNFDFSTTSDEKVELTNRVSLELTKDSYEFENMKNIIEFDLKNENKTGGYVVMITHNMYFYGTDKYSDITSHPYNPRGVPHIAHLFSSNYEYIDTKLFNLYGMDEIHDLNNWILNNQINVDFYGNIINNEDYMMFLMKFSDTNNNSDLLF